MSAGTLQQQVEQIGSARALKHAYRQHRKAARRADRKRFWCEVRCFWTRPLMHEWAWFERDDEMRSRFRACVGCGKRYGG